MSSAEQSGDNPKQAGSSNSDLVRQLSEAVSRLAGEVAGPLRRVSLQAGGAAVELEWDSEAWQQAPSAPSAPSTGQAQASESATEVDGQTVVRSPMVGTFYHAPTPGELPFVSVGGMVEPDTVIGIVEAMKLMNQVTAEAAGVVRHVLAPDGKPVEFEQPLIVLDPLPDQQWAG